MYYNEEKVGKGEAVRLALRNYEALLVPPEIAQRQQVAYVLEEQAALNARISKPTFHVSLSLAPGEKPDAGDLLDIADRYMLGLGYGQQPYAVYQHFDTDHTHVHIVSVRVDYDGNKVPDKFEQVRSNKLRQEIEKEFGLMPAEQVARRPKLAQLRPLVYGEGDLKRDMTNVVLTVLKDFRFSTFAQYNQLLRLYNVRAEEVELAGAKQPGLRYRIIDAQGNAQGPGLKASSLTQQPTLATVERRMKAGKKIKEDNVSNLRRLLEPRLVESTSWSDFHRKLHGLDILILPHHGVGGNLFGVSFLDVKRKAIYSGSEIGKEYSANHLKSVLGANYEPGHASPAPINDTAKQEITPSSSNLRPQQVDLEPEVSALSNASLLRDLLRAISGQPEGQESEQELKKMVKKSRQKPRLS
ncbi:conjugal transfer protein MobB [Nibrella saemangeumensis]|uniref:Conjugal transfer protein MobB n=1 Tax=Nibrella saemangeumensis TaxID=1084526 RepID=A0ABP8NF15_9BACT